MKDTNYAFCVAKIRALENNLLSKQDITSLIGQKDLEAALDFLVQKGFSNENEEISEIIKRHTEELNSVLSESVPDKSKLDALYILNDYFNLKVIVKSAVEKTKATELFVYPTTIDASEFDSYSENGEFLFLKQEYREVVKEAYGIALKTENGKFSDAVIDSTAIDALTAYAKSKNSGILGKICAFLADTADIKLALRCVATKQDADFIRASVGNCCLIDKEKLITSAISGEEELTSYLESTGYNKALEIYKANPSAFEKWCDDTVMEIASEAVYKSFGFDPVVFYFYRKSLEIKTVRMILAAVKSDVDRAIINERVRTLYA